MRFLFISMLALVSAVPAQANEFSVTWSSVNSGGSMDSSGGAWELKGSIGQANAAMVPAQGGAWRVQSGFWAGFQAQAVPGLQVDPVLLSFGEQTVGQAGDALLVTLSNSGAVSLEIVGINVATGDVADFSVEASACINGLAVGESCTVEVVFTPGGEGPRSAVMQIHSTAPGSPSEVLLLGVGVPELPEDDMIFKDRFRFLSDPQIGQM